MKNKGFTLIELVGTIILLSLVAVIAVPKIYNGITEYRESAYKLQVDSIINLTKNWMADHSMDSNFPDEDDETLFIYLSTLKDEGYLDDEFINPKTKKNFNDLVFTIITCHMIEGNDMNNSNYKYTFQVIDNTTKYLEYMASLWLKDNEASLDLSTVDTNEKLIKTLLPDDLKLYVDETLYESNTKSIKDIENNELIKNYKAEIYVKKENENYKYNIVGIVQ